MSSERQLRPGSENAHASSVAVVLGRKDEDRLRVIELACDRQHLIVSQPTRIRKHRERIAPVEAVGEDVGSIEVVRHAPKNVRRAGPRGYQCLANLPPEKTEALDRQRHDSAFPARSGTEQAFIYSMSLQRSGGRAKSKKRAAELRLGPAGWLYKDWEGIVYPREKPSGFDPLRYIADFFDTVKINSTFYGPPVPRRTSSWVKRVKEHHQFRFTAKLWKRFTHERDKAWSRGEADQVRQGFDVMMDADKLGAVLMQFPWSFKRTEANREWQCRPVAAGARRGDRRGPPRARSAGTRGARLCRTA